MTDHAWDLWFEYQDHKDELQQWYKTAFEEDYPGQPYTELTDEELILLAEEYYLDNVA